MEEQKEWLTPKMVQDQYQMSASTLAKWRMARINLKFSKIGKYIKYRRSDIEEFLRKHAVEVA